MSEKRCSTCGKEVDYYDTNLLLFKVVNIQLREFQGIDESEDYICIECLKRRLK